MSLILFTLIAALAFVNGANDNCKGVATLVGHGAVKPRTALLWAMVTTAVGSLGAYWIAGGLLRTFSTALFAKDTTLNPSFFAAVLVGATGWIFLATRTGLPVSTTHAIIGSLVGAGIVMVGHAAMQWRLLGATFAIPLLLSPLLSMLTVYLVAWPLGLVLSRVAGRCVCVTQPALAATNFSGATAPIGAFGVIVDTEDVCAVLPITAGISTTTTSNAIHWLSSGLVGFARGWNDAPKIAALGLIALSGGHGTAISFGVVTGAMALGGLVAGRRVLDTLATKLTPMPLVESLTASLMTATLVCLASWNSLPVSTTHVSTGAIIGAGLKHDPRGMRWGKVSEIVLAWIVTLPVSALLAGAAALVILGIWTR
ncbi:MAG: inorganic phosphate transporter [Planctomycetia bacterium]|nr:inorganic phosphate transporter [Planctomycetia bacterium]